MLAGTDFLFNYTYFYMMLNSVNSDESEETSLITSILLLIIPLITSILFSILQLKCC